MLSQVEFLIAAIDGPPLALLDPVALDSPRILPQLPNCGGAHPVHGVEFNDPSKIHSLFEAPRGAPGCCESPGIAQEESARQVW